MYASVYTCGADCIRIQRSWRRSMRTRKFINKVVRGTQVCGMSKGKERLGGQLYESLIVRTLGPRLVLTHYTSLYREQNGSNELPPTVQKPAPCGDVTTAASHGHTMGGSFHPHPRRWLTATSCNQHFLKGTCL